MICKALVSRFDRSWGIGRTLTEPTAPYCAKYIPIDCSVTEFGRPATWMLVVRVSPVSNEPVETGACSRAARRGQYVASREGVD
jgi:hypothetical protein